MENQRIVGYVRDIGAILDELPIGDIERACEVILAAKSENRVIFLAGNGGSAATATHLACDMAKGPTGAGMLRLKAISLTDGIPALTAWSNDLSYSDALANQLSTLASPGDVLMAISTSGNSPNLVAAATAARRAGLAIIALTGASGGYLRDLVDVCVRVPSDRCEYVEDVHLLLGHLICDALRGALVSELTFGLSRR
ncbi:MAG: SIS domain-containing protein [Chloroflexi bacterium]|nr:SIS domain-containing protein [Chloroflexota bacterium]